MNVRDVKKLFEMKINQICHYFTNFSHKLHHTSIDEKAGQVLKRI